MSSKQVPDEFRTWIRENWGADKLPKGGVVPFHSSYGYRTGNWATVKPFISKDKCISCFNCFYYCPDSAIEMDENNKAQADFNYCKGCGICAKHCPADAIEMISLRWQQDEHD